MDILIQIRSKRVGKAINKYPSESTVFICSNLNIWRKSGSSVLPNWSLNNLCKNKSSKLRHISIESDEVTSMKIDEVDRVNWNEKKLSFD